MENYEHLTTIVSENGKMEQEEYDELMEKNRQERNDLDENSSEKKSKEIELAIKIAKALAGTEGVSSVYMRK